MSCSKCACKKFIFNPVSAAQKLFSGTKVEVKGEYKGKSGSVGGNVSAQGMPYQDNKSDQVACRNCLCGHHYNYHQKNK